MFAVMIQNVVPVEAMLPPTPGPVSVTSASIIAIFAGAATTFPSVGGLVKLIGQVVGAIKADETAIR